MNQITETYCYDSPYGPIYLRIIYQWVPDGEGDYGPEIDLITVDATGLSLFDETAQKLFVLTNHDLIAEEFTEYLMAKDGSSDRIQRL
jgi:hypothetical protein